MVNNEKIFSDLILPRFLHYVTVHTSSDRHIEDVPSTEGQWDLAKILVKELKELGLSDVSVDSHCYVMAFLPASAGCEHVSPLGFMAHLDTAEDVSGKNVTPVVTRNYDGKKIILKNGITLDPAEDGDLSAQAGKTIIHSNGLTLLGADDKAGIAEIMAALEYLVKNPEFKHGPVEIVFSPDEETGKGLPFFPLEKFKSKAFYTLDGGALGEIEAECFNALSAKIHFTGRVIHLGQARGRLANAALMAGVFASMLPRSESPEATDAYYGYYCVTEIRGSLESAELEIYIRDFDLESAKQKAANLEIFAKAVEAQFPGGKVSVETSMQYYNMKEKINRFPQVLEKLLAAAAALGIPCILKPIRGGTDGSRLTELGIPTPNIFTGGRNFHSVREWAALGDMAAAAALVTELIWLWAL